MKSFTFALAFVALLGLSQAGSLNERSGIKLIDENNNEVEITDRPAYSEGGAS